MCNYINYEICINLLMHRLKPVIIIISIIICHTFCYLLRLSMSKYDSSLKKMSVFFIFMQIKTQWKATGSHFTSVFNCYINKTITPSRWSI